MNRYSQNIISAFTSQENLRSLRAQLSDFFDDPTVDSFLAEHLPAGMFNFREVILREMNMSDPMPGFSLQDQLDAYNVQFTRGYVNFIKDHVKIQSPAHYTVSDGLPTSRYGAAHHGKSAAHILDTWLANSARQVQIREDSGADAGMPTYYGQGLESGVAFCDQSHLGTTNHIEQYENRSYKVALNSMLEPHQRTPFGVSSVDADSRLLSRRTRADGPVRSREASLQRRCIDRDVAEGLRGGERDYINRGFDMSGLRARADYTAARAARSVPVESRLQYH